MLKFVYPVVAGLIAAAACRCTGPLDNPSDSRAATFTVASRATVAPVDNGPYYQFDTVAFAGGVTSKPVEKEGLVHEYAWDFGGDGSIDTVLRQRDTLHIRLDRAGAFTVALHLRDGTGAVSHAQTTINVVSRFDPHIFLPGLYLPDVKVAIDTVCAFYTQSEYTMRPVLLLGRYLTYRNKSESLTLGSFVFELLKNLAGTLDYSALTLPYRRGFDRGIYALGNDSITVTAVFHYGPGVEGHAENDTIRDDLFSPQSYVKSFRAQAASPYYSFEKGPLWNLSSGFSVNVSNPLSPKISLKIAMADLKFSCYREVSGRYTMSSEMNDTGGLTYPTFEDFLFNYHGLARIHPLRIGDIGSIVEADSLEIDMAGSRIETDSLPMTFSLVDGRDTLRSAFDFRLRQIMDRQSVRFGTGGGNRKVTGSYGAQSGLSVDKLTFATIYFDGVYSTAAADTAFFFCDEARASRFGTLYFDVPDNAWTTFDSERYGYRFVMKQSTVTLVK